MPLAGLDGKEKNAWWKLAELWTVSPIFNIVAGGVMAVLLSVHGVLPFGAGKSVTELAGAQSDDLVRRGARSGRGRGSSPPGWRLRCSCSAT